MAAYAALLSLMNNLEQIQRHTRLPISIDQTQVISLHEKVSFLIGFLECYSHGYNEEMNDFECRITDAAYAAEDIIETHVVDRIVAYSQCIPSKRTNKMVSYLKCILPRKKMEMVTGSTRLDVEKVLEEMEFLKEEAMMIKDRMGVEKPLVLKSSDHIPSSSDVGKTRMVGFEEEILKLMERLTGHQSSRQIISVVGMGGIGKTTIAKATYENTLIVQYFDFRAWVSISQAYSLRQILLGLLSSESNHLSEEELGESLYKSLCGMRYLVVLDDMWSVEAWEMVKLFFPDNNNGSRIIVTTRISTVATHLSSRSLEMNLLDEDKSWTLFCEKVFGQESCPFELEEVGRLIVRNCKGLPLSIVVIGGLLVRSGREKEYWEYVARDTTAYISLEGDDQCMKILALSYHNLPIHLKPCFLYMGVFPEDEDIPVSCLIKLWIAEGFMKPDSSKELEVIGEEYLNDLISRNLILPRRHGLRGKKKSCMIHDHLRDLCLKEASKGKFLYVTKMNSQDKSHYISGQRRISIHHRSSSTKKYIPPVIDTLKPGSLSRSLICDVPEVFPLKNFRLLRILKMCDKYKFPDGGYSLDEAFTLFNSRLIEVNVIERPTFPSVHLLWNLQILVVRGIKKGPVAPLEIWEMTELRHLQFEYVLYLQDPPSEQTNRRDDAIMKNLQTLMHIENFRCRDEVVKKIPNIKRLEISYTRNITSESRLKNLALLKKLESLLLLFTREMAPSRSDLLSNLAFPNSLKKLTLSGCNLHWEDMTIIGSLSHLQILKLIFDAFKGPEWLTIEGEFRCLKHLKIHCCGDLMHWTAESCHFPRLEHLVLWSLDKLVEIPSGIGDLPTLQSIELRYCSSSAVTSAKQILEEQEELGNENLQVLVRCHKNSGLESLASDNFRVLCMT